MSTETKEVCGIELTSDFPTRRNSYDPEEMVRALVEHGTFTDASQQVGCAAATVRRWADAYPEIEEAYMKGRRALGHEAEQTMVRIMRGKKPPEASEKAGAPKASDMLRAAKKIVGVNHVEKDYTQSQKIIRKSDEEAEEVQKKIDEMDQDDLLDALNTKLDE